MMNEDCEDNRELMSGYLGNELDAGQRARLEAHLAGCPACRDELEELTLVVSASATLAVKDPPEEVWDDFLGNVYARMERRLGWTLFWLGCAALGCFGMYEFFIISAESPIVKLATGSTLGGIFILFISVLRQRMAIRKSDRYSKNVHH